MKLLLTSNGICNESIKETLLELIGKPFKQTKFVFVPTAANGVIGHKSWLIRDMKEILDLEPGFLDILDINAFEKDEIFPRLAEADVVIFGGGNVEHLFRSMTSVNMIEEYKKLLHTTIHVGISAGSRITGPFRKRSFKALDNPSQERSDKDLELLGLVDFYIIPHLNSKHFPKRTKETITTVASQVDGTIYALDDQSAVVVNGDVVSVVSEGEYFVFND